MRLERSFFLAAVVMLAGGTTACEREEVPRGQVVATVNGVEITVAELNEEARARGLAVGRDPALRGALVKELVDRKLLVEEARDLKVDRSPAYILAERRTDELLLAQQLLAEASTAGTMTEEKLAKVISDNPQMFAERAISTVDRLAVSGQVSEQVRKQLLKSASVDAMERHLKAAGLRPVRGQVTLDSAEPVDEQGRAILRLKAGERFALAVPGGFVAGQVLSVTPQPVPADKRLSVAREWLRRQQAQAALDSILERKRPNATISYQPGFDPAGAS